MEDILTYRYEPSFQDRSTDRQLAIIYQQGTDYSQQSASFAMFVAKPDLDIEAILAFEKEIQANCLIAIVTDNHEYPCLAIANRFIFCKESNVKDLAQALRMMSGDKAFISIDENDIKQGFDGRNTVSFISFYTTLNNLQHDLPNYQNQLKQESHHVTDCKFLISHITCSDDFNFDDQEKITTVNQSICPDELNIYYSVAFTDDTTDCHIASLFFWQDDSRPQVLSTRLENQLAITKERLNVALLSLLANKEPVITSNAIHLFMGYQYPKQATFLNLVQAPHLLMAGHSKQTTTKMLHTFMVSMLMQYSPQQVRLMLIDGENPIFTDYRNLPHLISPISDRANATQNLAWCQLEMERRYQLMSQTKSRTLADFNQKIDEANKLSRLLARYRDTENPSIDSEQITALLQPLPRIVVIVSELRELMLDGTLPNEQLITNLAIKARAAGIHLILSTNHPSVDVLTDLVKAHIDTRLSFKVNTKVDSQTILDRQGAELLADEDMLFIPSYSDEPKYLQPIFATPTEISQACEQWQLHKKLSYVATKSLEIDEMIEKQRHSYLSISH